MPGIWYTEGEIAAGHCNALFTVVDDVEVHVVLKGPVTVLVATPTDAIFEIQLDNSRVLLCRVGTEPGFRSFFNTFMPKEAGTQWKPVFVRIAFWLKLPLTQRHAHW